MRDKLKEINLMCDDPIKAPANPEEYGCVYDAAVAAGNSARLAYIKKIRDRAEKAEAEVDRLKAENDELQRQLDEARATALDMEDGLASGCADFIREHGLGNEYWCRHQAAEALEQNETRSREEMLKAETPLCGEEHCRTERRI